jgi:hypothetical protein
MCDTTKQTEESVAREIMFTFPEKTMLSHDWTIIIQGKNVVSTFTNCFNAARDVFNSNTKLRT